MKKLSYLILALLVALNILGCKKNDDGLPKASQSGKGIMGAKVDGEIWTNKGRGNFFDRADLRGTLFNDYLTVYGDQYNENRVITIQLVIKAPKSDNTFELSNGYFNPPLNYALLFDNVKGTFYTNANNKGTVKITKFDQSSKIVSGTFEFIAEDRDGSGATVNVTSGRFDVNYKDE